MILNNHIATRLLTDKTFWGEMVHTHYLEDVKKRGEENCPTESYAAMYSMLDTEGNRSFIVTKSVTDKLSLFDNKKALDIEGWKVFESLPPFKKTFILPDNKCIRVVKTEKMLYFCYITFTFLPKEQRTKTTDDHLHWVLLFVDLENNRLAEHFLSDDGKAIAPSLYSLMCFVELCDNETVVVEPGRKYGTRKEGKIINTLPTALTIINNTWNVVTIRTEGFPVSGHAAFRWCGTEGNKRKRLVYIEPYMKKGYKRGAGKTLSNSK